MSISKSKTFDVCCLGLTLTLLLAVVAWQLWPLWQEISIGGFLHSTDNSVSKLIADLNSTNSSSRVQAIDALAKQGQLAVPALIECLNDDDASVRANAALALGRIGPQASATVPFLAELLADQDHIVRRHAAFSMYQIDANLSDYADAFVKLLSDTDPQLVNDARTALAKMGTNATPKLLDALKAQNSAIRWNAIELLGKTAANDDSIKLALREALGDEEPQVRQSAFNALAQIQALVIDDIITALADRDVSVRAKAAASFYQLASPGTGQFDPEAKRAIPSLIQGLQDESLDVRRSVANAVGVFEKDAEAAVPALVELLGDEDVFVAQFAARSLTKIDSAVVPGLIDQLMLKLRSDSVTTRRSAAAALSGFGPPAKEAVPVLIELLTDDYVVRSFVAEALGNIGPDAAAAIPRLMEAMKEREGRTGEAEDARWRANNALARIGLAAVPALIEALEDNNFYVRQRAAFALHDIGPGAKEAVPALLERFKKEKLQWAANALKRIDPDAAAEAGIK